eukprot:3522150-Pyramimonas_sp.AAC.1
MDTVSAMAFNTYAFASNRVSYFLGLHGASLRWVVWSSEDAQKSSTPTIDRESRCTVHKGGTWFASLHRLPTTVMLKIPRG